MPYAAFSQDREYLIRKFRTPTFDPASGMDNQTVMDHLQELAEKDFAALPRLVAKARLFDYICKHIALGISPHDLFPAFGCYDRNKRPAAPVLHKWGDRLSQEICPELAAEKDALNETGILTIWRDFDHAVPDWDAVMQLGFPGLRERAEQYRQKCRESGRLTPDAESYYDSLKITADAILHCIGRMISIARNHPEKDHPRIRAQIDCLEQLRTGAPRTLYEALMLNYLFFMFGEHIDHMQVRSLGNLDNLLYPYYQRDLQTGRLTPEQIRELFAIYLMQWGSINNYWGHPFYLGGTAEDGSSMYNELTYIILDVFDKLDIPTPKIQLKISRNTPEKLFRTAFEMIRRRQRSLVFVSEEEIARVLTHNGCTAEEARTCNISGCYEFAPRGKSNGTGAGHVNLVKPLELVFHDGQDVQTGYQLSANAKKLAEIRTFEEFLEAYLAYLDAAIQACIRCSYAQESDLHMVNPGAVFSMTIQSSLEQALDAFSSGCKYKNSGILMCGLASAVDGLLAVKHFVFTRREVTLPQWKEILDCNYEGHELFRRKILNFKEKFGNGLPEPDQLAAKLAKFISARVNGVPNARGGVYHASGHCARQFITQGERTAATPDGRRAGEEFSKNLSPAMGMDRSGVTALLKSLAALDPLDFPGDFPLDVMLHPTTVQGEAGFTVLRTVVTEFFRNHGLAIHFNIMDPRMLREAQKCPEAHEGLQVRICGWNVRFNDICKKEQDAYIDRAEKITE